tara:strand:- start:155 stop:388 length:234 start_codon:yes stop_codon:yes gene_type:complete
VKADLMGNLKNIWVLALASPDVIPPQYFPTEEKAREMAGIINQVRIERGKEPYSYSVITALQYKLLLDYKNEFDQNL